jgi:hypothetical protein
MNTAAAGYARAPVSLTVSLITAAASIITPMVSSNRRQLLALSLNPWASWRLASTHVCFSSPGELLFGLVLLYQFRVFERLFGPKKFAVRRLAFLFLFFFSDLSEASILVAPPLFRRQ